MLCDWDQMEAEEITELYTRKVARGESLTVARIEVKEGAITHPHSHENEEMILVLKGSWRFQLPSGEVTVNAEPDALHSARRRTFLPGARRHGSHRHLRCNACRLGQRRDQSLHTDPDQSLWAV